jgi:hypothetical protein
LHAVLVAAPTQQLTRVVVRRQLYNIQLNGSVPASLGSLTALQTLCGLCELLAGGDRGCTR